MWVDWSLGAGVCCMCCNFASTLLKWNLVSTCLIHLSSLIAKMCIAEWCETVSLMSTSQNLIYVLGGSKIFQSGTSMNFFRQSTSLFTYMLTTFGNAQYNPCNNNQCSVRINKINAIKYFVFVVAETGWGIVWYANEAEASSSCSAMPHEGVVWAGTSVLSLGFEDNFAMPTYTVQLKLDWFYRYFVLQSLSAIMHGSVLPW